MAHFLIDASLPRSTETTILAHGHQATDVRSIGMGAASDDDIARCAQQQHMALITADLDFANLQSYPPADYFGIVVIRPPDQATASGVLGLVEQFLQATDVLDHIIGHLIIVEPARIRVRPPI